MKKMTTSVTIRTKHQLEHMPQGLQVAIAEALKDRDRSYPVVYQYLHNPKEPLIVDADNTMGHLTNIQKNKHGDIVGDLSIILILKVASHFQGVIDNIAASYAAGTGVPTIDAFIIYDSIAKAEILRKKKEAEDDLNARLAKPGEIPFVASDDGIDMKEITGKLIREFEKVIGEQQEDKINDKED